MLSGQMPLRLPAAAGAAPATALGDGTTGAAAAADGDAAGLAEGEAATAGDAAGEALAGGVVGFGAAGAVVGAAAGAAGPQPETMSIAVVASGSVELSQRLRGRCIERDPR